MPAIVFLITLFGMRIAKEFFEAVPEGFDKWGLKTLLGAVVLIAPLSVSNVFAALGTNIAMRVLGNEIVGFLMIVAATVMAGAVFMAGGIDQMFSAKGATTLMSTTTFWVVAVLNCFGCLLLAARSATKND